MGKRVVGEQTGSATEAELARFWGKVEKTSTCWLWVGAINGDGYGRYYFRGHLVRAHAFALWLRTGRWERYVMHPCDVPACVRHGISGTHKKNIEDMVNKGRAVPPVRDARCDMIGELNGRSVVSDERVKEIRALYATGQYKQKELGQMFGVVQTQISRIVLGKAWKHAEGERTATGRGGWQCKKR